jgi:hypothetical protein
METLKAQRQNTSWGKTFCCIRVNTGQPCWTSVMVQLTALSIMCFAVLQRACKVGCLDKWLSNWRGRCADTCQELLRQCETKGDGFLEHISEWRWKLRPLLKAWHEESKQRMAPFQLTKTQTIQRTGICEKSDANCILTAPVLWSATSLGVFWY